jgi:hypothetical protein
MPSAISSANPVAPTPTSPLEIGPPPPPPPVVSIEPVHITGDAGARELLRRLDASPPSCRAEAAAAVEGGLPMAIDIAGVVLGAAAGPVVLGLGVAKLFHDSVKEGEALRALYDCTSP